MPDVSMEIQSMTGLAEEEYLKKPGLPKSTDLSVAKKQEEEKQSNNPMDKKPKEKKKRVVSQKQLDSLKKAREASVAKRKKIREEKEAEKQQVIKPKKQVKESKKILEPIEESESSESESSESESSEEEVMVKTPRKQSLSKAKKRKKINYDTIINGVVGQMRASGDNDRHQWRKEWENAEEIRMDERNKLLGLVKQMEVAETMKTKTKPVSNFNPYSVITNGQHNSQPVWEDCFNGRGKARNKF